MATVSETELKQKTSEYIQYVNDFAANIGRDIKIMDGREGFVFTIYDKDVTLDFSL